MILKDIDLPQNVQHEPSTIEVKGEHAPSFTIKFNSASSKVNLFHEHEPSKAGVVQKSFSEDAAHVMKHKVMKPIIQEVHEIISPFRKVVREIKPVLENIQTVVSTSQHFNDVSNKKVSLGNKHTSNKSTFSKTSFFNSFKMDQNTEVKPNSVEEGRREPDLVLTEDNMIDDSLYSGHSHIDLRYVSPNLNDDGNQDSLFIKDFALQTFKDRR